MRSKVRSCQAPQMPSVQGCENGVGKASNFDFFLARARELESF